MNYWNAQQSREIIKKDKKIKEYKRKTRYRNYNTLKLYLNLVKYLC